MGSDKGWVASLVHASLNCYKLVIIVGIFWEPSNHLGIKQSDINWLIQQCFSFQMLFASFRQNTFQKLCLYPLPTCAWFPSIGLVTVGNYDFDTTSILMHTPRLPKVHFHSAPKCNYLQWTIHIQYTGNNMKYKFRLLLYGLAATQVIHSSLHEYIVE